jgi:hypothetical protein
MASSWFACNLFCPKIVLPNVLKFLLWCILLVLCWPLALLALIVYPLVWILLIPFRIVGIAVNGVLELLRGIFTLPARLVSGPRASYTR